VLEDERTNLSREVHDVLGQQITALKMDMSWLNKKIVGQEENVKERFESMIAMTDEMVKTVREISTRLRPGILDDLGLVAALEWQSTEFEKQTGIKCHFTANGILPELMKSSATGIFRIYQETLTNVARHSAATKVDTSILCNATSLRLDISDNGKGLNTIEMNSKKTLGIIGMKERAAMMNGNLTIESPKKGGTVVSLSVALNGEPSL
jgi:signal transduction histidine kinase